MSDPHTNIEEWPQFQALKKEVEDELNSPYWPNATHGTPYLYNRGCHGPLCKRANRMRKMDENSKQPLEFGYLERVEAEYFEKKRAAKIAEYMEKRPPGTTRIDWIERAMQIGQTGASIVTPAELFDMLAGHQPVIDCDGAIRGCRTCDHDTSPGGYDSGEHWRAFVAHIADEEGIKDGGQSGPGGGDTAAPTEDDAGGQEHTHIAVWMPDLRRLADSAGQG